MFIPVRPISDFATRALARPSMPVGGIAWTAEVYPGQLEINGDLCCAHGGIPPEVMELEWLGNYTDKVEVLPYMRQGPSWRHPPWNRGGHTPGGQGHDWVKFQM